MKWYQGEHAPSLDAKASFTMTLHYIACHCGLNVVKRV